MSQSGLDIVPHGLFGLSGQSKQQTAFVKRRSNHRRVAFPYALVQHILSKRTVKGLHPGFDFHLDACLGKPLPQGRQHPPVHPVTFKMQNADVLVPADLLNAVDRFGIQFGERPRIDDFQMVIAPSHLLQSLDIERIIAFRVAAAVGMIVAKGAAQPLTAQPAQQHDLPWIFVLNHRITHHDGFSFSANKKVPSVWNAPSKIP